MSAEVGFDALFFGRIDYQDRAKRMKEKSMEMIWQGSASLPNLRVFTGAFTSGNYFPPNNICFDTRCLNDPVVDDVESTCYNAEVYVRKFLDAAVEEASYSRGKHVMFKMGSDFHYSNADIWFSNLDKLIKLVNAADAGVNTFYSTPQQYIDARAQEGLTWPLKTDDFFPYADCAHCYWSGYFTSRPTLKRLERVASTFLQTLRRIHVAATARPQPTHIADRITGKVLHDLEAAIGLANHHDSITGTSKQHVADDYIRIVDKALTAAEALSLIHI